jgi:RNA polymerase sigma factor (sigma-70 family)
MNDNGYKKMIEDYARVAYRHLRKPTVHTVDDMIQEGHLVLIKDVLPRWVPPGKPGYKASFNTYLRTCLRNHFVDLMKKSFRYSEESNERYEKMRMARRSNITTDSHISINLIIEDFIPKLTYDECKYVNLLLKHKTRSEARSIMRISSVTENKWRKKIKRKLIGDKDET